MKRFRFPAFILIILTTLSAMSAKSQNPVKDYAANWKKVEAFQLKNLPKSAVAEVSKIYALAKKENQDAQIIKSLIYMTNLQSETREDNEAASIKEIEKEYTTGIGSREPAHSLLAGLLAGMYQAYYENNRWELMNRSETKSFKKEDIDTWSAGDFHQKISELYLRSVKEERILQQTSLKDFDAIIIKGNMRHLRPTLYDLLAFRALDYFAGDESGLTKPAYAFTIGQAEAFAPAAEFIKTKFITQDSLSLHHKALQLYQHLLAFHIKDTKADALIDADLMRLSFVKDKSVHSDKEALYLKALHQLADKYGDLPAAAQVWYLIAATYNEKADEYRPFGDTTQRYTRIKAKEICERIMAQKDSSEGKLNAAQLLQSIKLPAFYFTVEKVNVPGQPFRALVSYEQVSTLYFRLIKPDESLKKLMEEKDASIYWPALANAKAEQSWEQALPQTNDLQPHSTEIRINALPAGEYILVASNGKDFRDKQNILGARFFYVSSISYISTNNKDYFVLDRDNGKPLAKAAVQVWNRIYDSKQSKYIRQAGKLYTTDGNGYFRLERGKEQSAYSYEYILFDVKYGKERLFMSDWTSNYFSSAPEERVPEYKVFLFTDRSLYRPGQTVYFKGIALKKEDQGRKNSLLRSFSTKVFLNDANDEQVDSMTVKTNEYGSFSGVFHLPSGSLNGSFSISTATDGSVEFHVEEYKRPKFYVDYETLKGTYKVNDSIKVTGFAKAYAGNNIDGATVKYRVERQPRFIYSWMFWRWWQPPTPSMEITHGEVRTDKDGKFTVSFNAIPDLSIDKKFEPVFDYTVYADVTDINGETRSEQTTVSVSYHALMLNLGIPETMVADSLKKINISTLNMNGEFIPATVSLSITRLKAEKRLIRERFWGRPDQFVMSKEEYLRNFPYDEYANETDKHAWEEGEKVHTKTDSSRANGEWKLQWAKPVPGHYKVEVTTTDKDGSTIRDIAYIELTDPASPQLSNPAYITTLESKTTVEPGENATVQWGSSADSVHVIKTILKEKQEPQFSFLNINNEIIHTAFSVTEADRAGYTFSWAFVKHNRFHEAAQTINIPWTDKELKIEYLSFRDKTLPGSAEKWKVRISGYKKEKVAAEMLAGMYDASLDQFYPHYWNEPDVWPSYYAVIDWQTEQNFGQISSDSRYRELKELPSVEKEYDHFIGTDVFVNRVYSWSGRGGGLYERRRMAMDAKVAPMASGEILKSEMNGLSMNFAAPKIVADTLAFTTQVPFLKVEKTEKSSGDIKIRKNFNETAFFLPELHTDSTGAIEFSFTLPESLTKWKFMALAHTKDAAFGSSTKEIVTQKELMVQPNPPRFLREGDNMEFSAKVVNMTDSEITGQAQLLLFDAATNEPVDGWFRNMIPNQYFTIGAGQSEAMKFPIEVPYLFNKALIWRIVARSGDHSDGEENALPVLSNRMLVTETQPLSLRGNGTKNYSFDKLKASGSSETLQSLSLTAEYSSNPAWYAVQSLPYLMQYPYECAEQTWNKYYANSIAATIANSSPKLQQIFETWKNKDTAALLSNLQKNPELKAVLLEETPWVLEAKSENERKKNIGLLFDLMRMKEQLSTTYDKLKQMQLDNGGFVWFKGGPDDRYITQYIVTGIGHLKKLKAYKTQGDGPLKAILETAIPYLDKKLKADYDELIRYKTKLTTYTPGYTTIQYLYMRSFFPEYPIAKASLTAYNYFRGRVQKTWTTQSKYMQGMTALALSRTADAVTPKAILKSLKETSISNEELGMYWKSNAGWYWYEAPIETQALLIEAFGEAGKDTATVDALKTWLLKNKQTNDWKTTKATAEACYALLLQGTQWLESDAKVEIRLGNTSIRSDEVKTEAGTGYFKQTIPAEKIGPDMGNITVTVNGQSSSPSWGAVYWQYFEDLDKITPAATPLKLVKKLFVEKNTDRGPVLEPVNEGDVLHVGDKIKVRVELRVDRNMEYVHMKDMRASCLEPVNVLSEYKWQGGLGYYESTKDASTNFFFSYLNKGTYVFEYPLFVTHTGNFSNGITSIQCMYAPEFSAHSEGIRINVE